MHSIILSDYTFISDARWFNIAAYRLLNNKYTAGGNRTYNKIIQISNFTFELDIKKQNTSVEGLVVELAAADEKDKKQNRKKRK